jgi:hypothetical protein
MCEICLNYPVFTHTVEILSSSCDSLVPLGTVPALGKVGVSIPPSLKGRDLELRTGRLQTASALILLTFHTSCAGRKC